MVIWRFVLREWNAEKEAIAGLKNLQPELIPLPLDQVVEVVESLEGVDKVLRVVTRRR